MNNACRCCLLAMIISHSLVNYSCSKAEGIRHNKLPAITSINECDISYSSDVCAWARTADAIGWVRIETIGFVYEPIIKASLGNDLIDIDSCDGIVMPSVRIGVVAEDMIINNGIKIDSIVIGANRIKGFIPFPSAGASGEIVWVPEQTDLGRKLDIGDVIGVAIVKIEGMNSWTIGSSRLFYREHSEDGAERVWFQHAIKPCDGDVYTSLNGMDIKMFSKKLVECCGNAIRTIKNERPSSIEQYAAICYPREADDAQECITDADCRPNEVCDRGECR